MSTQTPDGAPTRDARGTLRRLADGSGAVHVRDTYDTGIEDLWAAVTEPERLARWIARVEGDLRPGGRFHARFTSAWEGPGQVEVCEPPSHLVVRMAPGTADETVIEASLAADGAGTLLVVEERGFPLPELAAHGAGWQAHLEDLTAHLQGRPPADLRQRWIELSPAYRDLAILPEE
jgi:uncharacterized protein YndB with AHSA1/START domain